MITSSDGNVYEDETAHALDVKQEPQSLSGRGSEAALKPVTGEAAKSMTHSAEPEPDTIQKTVKATIQHFQESLMSGPNMMKDFMEGKQSSEDPEAGPRGLGVAFQASTGAMPFAEKGAAGIFGGRLSPQAIGVAEKMDKKGFPHSEIKELTGLERGAEGMWRREFDDSKAQLNLPTEPRVEQPPSWTQVSNMTGPDKLKQGTYKLEDVLNHDELYDSYPELKRLPVQVKDVGANRQAYAHIEHGNEGADYIALHHQLDPETVKPTVMHEIQHIIQGRSGFSLGNYERLPIEEQDSIRGNLLKKYAAEDINAIYAQADKGYKENRPGQVELARIKAQRLLDNSDYLMYRAEAYEQEAWNVAKRISMSRSERAKSLGRNTETIDRQDQIIY